MIFTVIYCKKQLLKSRQLSTVFHNFQTLNIPSADCFYLLKQKFISHGCLPNGLDLGKTFCIEEIFSLNRQPFLLPWKPPTSKNGGKFVLWQEMYDISIILTHQMLGNTSMHSVHDMWSECYMQCLLPLLLTISGISALID